MSSSTLWIPSLGVVFVTTCLLKDSWHVKHSARAALHEESWPIGGFDMRHILVHHWSNSLNEPQYLDMMELRHLKKKSYSNKVKLYFNGQKTKFDIARGKKIGWDQNGKPICCLVLKLPPFLVRVNISCELVSCYEGLNSSCKATLRACTPKVPNIIPKWPREEAP